MSRHHVTEYSVGQVIEQMEFGGFYEIQVVSKTIGTWKSRLAKLIPSLVISIVGSHHQLESTVFFLARRIN